ncbi:hypothetical protein [Magnetospirillum aberrantis]|uniref:Uncharacterized protein n=1 Tax=Magnetospirillum aberrantis SpK TaxID=908842 RepID=A0A7C9QT34_9PROT|nr:hypothetical protein [Magnetospirillum aberrantis]NFV80018.1 hypothetical protein [Magnetospirillum aberrantis SpK]
MAGGLFALDLATNLGWTCAPVPPGPPPTALVLASVRMPEPPGGIYRVGTPGCSVGAFLSDYGDWFDRKLAALEPAGVIYEAPILPKMANHHTSLKLMGLAVLTATICYRRKVHLLGCEQPSTVKKHFTGHGDADKPAIIATCMNLGWNPIDDNHADSMALWSLGCHRVQDAARQRRGRAA